jgi:formylglycine-generating enzyme required for sulfatase activity
VASLTALLAFAAPAAQSLRDANEALLQRISIGLRLTAEQDAALRAVFAGSRYIGQGNPAVTVHPATPQQCRDKLGALGITYENERFERICGAPYMAPLYDPSSQQPEDAAVCIDMFEFPDLPCEYPVVWVRAREAAEMCAAVGRRLCDAHEWEGACAGSLEPPDYPFDLAHGLTPSAAVERMRAVHNAAQRGNEVWAYGPEYRTGICAAASAKSPGCDGGGWDKCGSNTYPTGMFPECRSALGVLDQHGNAAEHMNLPLAPDQMASAGSTTLGVTEMKGSWFIFDSFKAHEDACRWRAPYWHGGAVMSPDSHHNYHLGFRCCKTIE